MIQLHRQPVWAALGCLAVFSICPIIASSQEIEWRHDYSAAKREARQTNRPLVIDFGTAHCVWCDKLDASTFRDSVVVKLLGEHFIPVKVAADQDPQLAEALGVQSFPTLVFARPDGKILGMHDGFVDAEKFKGQLERALSESNVPISTPPPANPESLTGNKVVTRISMPPPAGETLQEENARLRQEIEQMKRELEAARGTGAR
jgi:thioredoxin-like negative regulator of GroEL